jgi:hypothetical protein
MNYSPVDPSADGHQVRTEAMKNKNPACIAGLCWLPVDVGIKYF